MDWFRFETRSSTPYTYRGHQLIVHSWVLQILTPGGGLIWNYPTAVSARPEGGAPGDGREERIPVIDVTRLAQLALFSLGLLVSILLWRKRS